jgi:hypothetical protein
VKDKFNRLQQDRSGLTPALSNQPENAQATAVLSLQTAVMEASPTNNSGEAQTTQSPKEMQNPSSANNEPVAIEECLIVPVQYDVPGPFQLNRSPSIIPEDGRKSPLLVHQFLLDIGSSEGESYDESFEEDDNNFNITKVTQSPSEGSSAIPSSNGVHLIDRVPSPFHLDVKSQKEPVNFQYTEQDDLRLTVRMKTRLVTRFII